MLTAIAAHKHLKSINTGCSSARVEKRSGRVERVNVG